MNRVEFLKFFGGVTVIVSGTLCGLYASRVLKNRVSFLEQYIMFLTQTKTMISYNAISAVEILSSVGSVPLVSPMLEECIKNLSNGCSFEDSWHKAVNSAYEKKLFTASDKPLIYSFGDTFGISDIDGEVTKTELHTALVSERLEKARQDFSSKCKIYRIVGMFSGIVIVLLIY